MTRLEEVLEQNDIAEDVAHREYFFEIEKELLFCCAGYLKNISESLAMLVDLERERKEVNKNAR